MPRKRTGKGTKRAGTEKTEAEPTMALTVPAVALTKQLAEAMRWRSMEWARIPALTRKLTMPYLTARDTINLDIAVSDKEERKHLVKAYVGLRSRGLDVYAHYRVSMRGRRDAGLIVGAEALDRPAQLPSGVTRAVRVRSIRAMC